MCFSSFISIKFIDLFFYIVLKHLKLKKKIKKIGESDFLTEQDEIATVPNRFTFNRRVIVQRGRVLEHGKKLV